MSLIIGSKCQCGGCVLPGECGTSRFARPVNDGNTGAWTKGSGMTWWQDIDETTPSDADSLPETPSANNIVAFIVCVTSLTAPSCDSVCLRVRNKVSGTGGVTDFSTRIVEATTSVAACDAAFTTKATENLTLSTDWHTDEFLITGADLWQWDRLAVQVQAKSSDGTTEFDVSWIEIELGAV